MAIKFKLKRGTSTPTTSDLDNGEVGVDTQAKIIYINDSGTVKPLGSDLGNVGQSIVPATDSTYNLGSTTKRFGYGYFDYLNLLHAATLNSTLTVEGVSYLKGHVNLGNSNADDILFYGSLDTDIIPKSDNTRKLGTSQYKFSEIYATSYYGDGSNLTGVAPTGNITPSASLTFDIGSNTKKYAHIFTDKISNNRIQGYNSQNIYLGANNSYHSQDIRIAPGSAGATYIDSNLLPYTNNSEDLGSSTYKWKDLYIRDIYLDDNIRSTNGNAGKITFMGGQNSGQIEFVSSANSTLGGLYFNVQHTFGVLKSDGTYRLKIDNNGAVDIYDTLAPNVNNTTKLGTSSKKWEEVHATTYYGSGANLTNLPAPDWTNVTNNLLPNIDNGRELGSSTKTWQRLYTGEVRIGGNGRVQFEGAYIGMASANGHMQIKQTESKEIQLLSKFSTGVLIAENSGDLMPTTDSSIDIGSNTVRFQNIYGDTLYGDGSNLTGVAGTGANTFTGNQTISNGDPKLILNDTTAGTSYSLYSDGGNFRIYNESSGGGIRFTVTSNGSVFTANNLDVSGNISLSGTVDGVDIAALNTTVSNITPGIASLVADSSPQLGGDLDTNGREIFMDHDKSIKFKNSSNTNCGNIEYLSGNFHITNAQGNILINNVATAGQVKINTENNFEVDVNTNDPAIIAKPNGAVELYNNGNLKFNTTTGGVEVTGNQKVSNYFSSKDTIYMIGGSGTAYSQLVTNSNDLLIDARGNSNIIMFRTASGGNNPTTTTGWDIETDGDLVPTGNKTVDIGSTSKKVDHAYIADAHVENLDITQNIMRTSTGGDIGSSTYKFDNVYATNFHGDGSNLTGISSDLVNDTTPSLGGNLNVNGKIIEFGDSSGATDDRLKIGSHDDLQLYHDGTTSIIQETKGDFDIIGNSIEFKDTAGNTKLETSSTSVDVHTGILGIKNTGTQSEVRLYCESNNAHYAAIKAPAHSSFSGNLTYTLPSSYGNNAQVLTSDGQGGMSWTTPSAGATVAGSNTQIQYNASGALAGSSNLTFDGTNLTVGGTISATSSGSSVAGHRKITTSTSTPSGGSDGDLWIQHN